MAHGAESPVLYRNDFSQDEVGKKPDGMVVLDGAFAVRAEADNRFLELPGAPLETYGVLFGPAQNQGAPAVREPNEPLDARNLSVTARVFGTRRGRRFPTFAVGLGGVGGYRLQVSPGKRELELFRGETDQASVPFEWTSGQWLWLKLQVRRIKEGEWRVEGRVWPDGAQPPTEWTIAWTDIETPKPGRASLWGSPFADTPIRFDDLSIERSP